MRDFHSGYVFNHDDGYEMEQAGFKGNGSFGAGTLTWYSKKGMNLSQGRRMDKHQYWNWYQNALGTVEYMDGYDLPALQDARDLVPEEGAEEPVLGRVPLAASGRQREFARRLEHLRTNTGFRAGDNVTVTESFTSDVGDDPRELREGMQGQVLRVKPVAEDQHLVIQFADGGDEGRAFEVTVVQTDSVPLQAERTADTIAQFFTDEGLLDFDPDDPSGILDHRRPENDPLLGQPRAVFEVLLLLCAEQHDWVNVKHILHEMQVRDVTLRSAAVAAMFSYVRRTHQALSIFEMLKKHGVRLHLNSYYALMSALQRIEEEEEAERLHHQWKTRRSAVQQGTPQEGQTLLEAPPTGSELTVSDGEAAAREQPRIVTEEMMEFIVGGVDDQLFPETNPVIARVNGRDPRADVAAAIDGLLRKDRAVIEIQEPTVRMPEGPQVLHRVKYS